MRSSVVTPDPTTSPAWAANWRTRLGVWLCVHLWPRVALTLHEQGATLARESSRDVVRAARAEGRAEGLAEAAARLRAAQHAAATARDEHRAAAARLRQLQEARPSPPESEADPRGGDGPGDGAEAEGGDGEAKRARGRADGQSASIRAEARGTATAEREDVPALAAPAPEAPAPEARSGEPRRFKTVVAAVGAAATDHADVLQFSARALRTAKQSRYQHPDEVYALLSQLAAVARTARRRPGAGGLMELHRQAGLEYAAGCSRSTNSRLRAQYEVRHAGRTVCCDEHVRRGVRAGHCLRVYFSSADLHATGLLIAWVGDHARVMGSN